jgi:hypothetical protein
MFKMTSGPKEETNLIHQKLLSTLKLVKSCVTSTITGPTTIQDFERQVAIQLGRHHCEKAHNKLIIYMVEKLFATNSPTPDNHQVQDIIRKIEEHSIDNNQLQAISQKLDVFFIDMINKLFSAHSTNLSSTQLQDLSQKIDEYLNHPYHKLASDRETDIILSLQPPTSIVDKQHQWDRKTFRNLKNTRKHAIQSYRAIMLMTEKQPLPNGDQQLQLSNLIQKYLRLPFHQMIQEAQNQESNPNTSTNQPTTTIN